MLSPTQSTAWDALVAAEQALEAQLEAVRVPQRSARQQHGGQHGSQPRRQTLETLGQPAELLPNLSRGFAGPAQASHTPISSQSRTRKHAERLSTLVSQPAGRPAAIERPGMHMPTQLQPKASSSLVSQQQSPRRQLSQLAAARLGRQALQKQPELDSKPAMEKPSTVGCMDPAADGHTLQPRRQSYTERRDHTVSASKREVQAVLGRQEGSMQAARATAEPKEGTGPQEWMPEGPRKVVQAGDIPGEGLYRRALERRLRNAEKYAELRAQAEAALTDGCTFAPAVNALPPPPRARSARPPAARLPFTVPRKPQLQQAAMEPVMPPSARISQQRPLLGSVTSGVAHPKIPSGAQALSPVPSPALRASKEQQASQIEHASQQQLLQCPRARTPVRRPAQALSVDSDERPAPVGLRLYQEGLELQRQKQESMRIMHEAEAADWRQARPTARPLDTRVYGREARARVEALRSRSTSPLPPSLRHRACTDDQCTFTPRTNVRRPATPPARQQQGWSTARPATATPPRQARAPAAPMLCTACPGLGHRPGSLAAALVQNAASLGLEVEDEAMPLRPTLDFTEFLARQTTFIQDKNVRAAEEQAQSALNRQPVISEGSRRILAARPSLDKPTPLHVPRPKSAIRSRPALPGLPGIFTFKPEISEIAAARRRRGPDELSTGDALRRLSTREQLAEQLRKHEALETTFKPQTLEYPGVASRLDAMQSSALHKALQEQREQQRIANLQASEDKELKQCTFSPRTQTMPSFIRKMANTYAMKTAPACRPKAAMVESLEPSRFYSTGPIPIASPVRVAA